MKPDHPWSGDEDGHDCVFCAPGSPWRCDARSHPDIEWEDPEAVEELEDEIRYGK